MTTTTSPDRAPVAPTGCCPPFDPAPYQDREVVWHDKLFVKEHVRSVFHIPLNMGSIIGHAQEKIVAAGAGPAQPLMLSDEISPWRSDLYIDVTRLVPEMEMATLTGTFLTRVYDGPYRDIPKWVDDMKRHVASRGRVLRKLYFAYTTCPRCAKAYGHNHVVLFAQVEPAEH
ncbi:MAG: hydrolase [Myxococcota bacterium]